MGWVEMEWLYAGGPFVSLKTIINYGGLSEIIEDADSDGLVIFIGWLKNLTEARLILVVCTKDSWY